MMFSFPAAILLWLLAPRAVDETVTPPSAGFAGGVTIPVGAAPHGIPFSADGREAHVAVSGGATDGETDVR